MSNMITPKAAISSRPGLVAAVDVDLSFVGALRDVSLKVTCGDVRLAIWPFTFGARHLPQGRTRRW
jgi:hypothetical protein